jgi:integrase
VDEVILGFWRHAQTHYRHPDGTPTTEVREIRHSLRPLRELYGATNAAEFGPKKLAAVRQEMIRLGWCRTLINRRIDRVKRCFKWAASEELIPVSVYQGLRTLAGLQAGRTTAREAEPVAPVAESVYETTLPHLPRVPRAMAELQRWTGMRPGEVCRLRLSEIDRTDPVWVYRPSRHKTSHRGKARVIPIGPKAQSVLLAFLAGRTSAPTGAEAFDLAEQTARLVAADLFEENARPVDAALLRDLSRRVVLFSGSILDVDAFIFDAARDKAERLAAWRATRKSKVTPSERSRRKAEPKRVPLSGYRPHAYTHAVRLAAAKAGVSHWHPNQLRHLRATEVRRGYGLEGVQVVLGHSRADVSQVYAERDEALAVRVAGETG